MRLRLQGGLLFLLIPLAVALAIVQPVQPLAALAFAVVLLVAFPFVAAPHVRRNLLVRCAWSGREIAPGCGYRVLTGGTETTLNFETDKKRERAARFFTFATRLAWPLRAALVLPFAYLVLAEALRACGVAAVPSHEHNVAIFQAAAGVVGLAVFIAFWFVEPIPHMKGPVPLPIPIPFLFVLGTFWALLVYAVAAACWIVAAARTFAA